MGWPGTPQLSLPEFSTGTTTLRSPPDVPSRGGYELSCVLEIGKVGCAIPGDNINDFPAHFKSRERRHLRFQQLSHQDHSQMETLTEPT